MLIIIVPTLIGQLLAVYLFYQRHWYNVSNHISDLLASEIFELLHSENYKSQPYKEQNYLNLSYTFIPDATVPNSPKRLRQEIQIFKETIKGKLQQEGIVLLDKSKKINLYLQLNNNLLKIKLPYKSLLNPTTYIFVLWIIFLTILLLSVSLIFSKNQIRSIVDLTNVAESYGIGAKTKIYKPSGSKEIRKAGFAFLKMKNRIERQTAKKTQMLAMISHDLKTPLTRMKLQVELMDESEEKEELKYDIESMQHMIASYLDFSRGEEGEKFKTVILNNWISKYVKNKWSDSNIIIKTEHTPINVSIKPHAFERAISNLISNALKHSTKIKISVYSYEGNAYINIEDNGLGIKEKDRKLIFKPFYRIDKSRSLDNSASVGLGLAITKEIIRGHYGTITLKNSKALKGLLVEIQFPLKEY